MSNFQETQLSQLVEKVASWDPTTQATNKIIDYIDISSIDRDRKQIYETTKVVGEEAPSRARQLVQAHDVLVSTVRPNLNAVAQVPETLDGATASTGYCILRPRNRDLDARYLFHWVRTPTFVDSMVLQATGASYPAVTDKIVKSSKIPLPPIEEQRRIAMILDCADALRAKRRAAIAKLDTLLQATFLDMFGDPVTNPMGWEVVDMANLLTYLTSGSRGWAEYYSDEGTIFLRIQNVQKDRLKLDDLAHVQAPDSAEKTRTTVQAGDVLLSITADLGRTAVIPPDFPPANINQHLAILRVKGVIPEYLSTFLSSSGGQTQFEKLNRQGVKAGLNFNDIKSLKILLPPSELQQKFTLAKMSIRQYIVQHQKSLTDFDHLFHSLQQRAFRGEL